MHYKQNAYALQLSVIKAKVKPCKEKPKHEIKIEKMK